MYNKIHKIIFILLLLYQTPLYSKSNSSNYFNVKDFSNYFSGIVAFENKDNSEALKYFNFSKDLLDQHSSYLKRYITTLVLEKKVPQAISVIKDIDNYIEYNFCVGITKYWDSDINKQHRKKVGIDDSVYTI